jgi:putative ABC transport system permease protein
VQEVHVDLRLVAGTFIVGVATTLLFALAPALQATRRDVSERLARSGRSQAGGRLLLQRGLVAAQVSLAIVLLVGAGLLIRSFSRVQQISPGFDPNGVLTFRMSAAWNESLAATMQRHIRTLGRLSAVPGVEAAAFSTVLPAMADHPPQEFHIAGRDPAEKTFSDGRSVSAGYFRTLHIPILQGATCQDDPATPFTKALVTRSFVDRFFPSGDAIGHAMVATGGPPGLSTEIIGIVGDVREGGLLKAPEPLIYWCGLQPYWPDPYFLVRTDPSHAASIAEIRAALREIEPKRAIYSVQPLSGALSESLTETRLNTLLLALFAAMALLLAAVGLYGVLSQLVSLRRREIGVRIALGAQASQILTGVAIQAAALTGVGVCAGLAGAFALSRVMSALLFGIQPHDPVTFAIVPAVLVLVAAAAAAGPARRAVSVDPIDALRED